MPNLKQTVLLVALFTAVFVGFMAATVQKQPRTKPAPIQYNGCYVWSDGVVDCSRALRPAVIRGATL